MYCYREKLEADEQTQHLNGVYYLYFHYFCAVANSQTGSIPSYPTHQFSIGYAQYKVKQVLLPFTVDRWNCNTNIVLNFRVTSLSRRYQN